MKKQRWEESEKRRVREEKRREEERRSEKRKSQKKEDQVREKVGKSRNTVLFQCLGALEGRKVGSLKRRVRSHLAKWEMKNCTPLWREARFEVKSVQSWRSRSTPLWREAHFEVKSVKEWRVRSIFGRFRCRLCGRRKGFCTLLKTSKTWWFCSSSKSVGRRGTFTDLKRICKDEFGARRSARYMFVRDVRRSWRWFPERRCILEHQIFRFATMILRDRCSTSYDLPHFFVAGAVL